ncbi:MAG: hypothetical protein AAGI08_14270 [Bacteroidota bacterium]
MLRKALLFAAGLLVIAGCDSSEFDPFQESDLGYSVFGYLDVSADTQFVRVSPIRQALEQSPEPLSVEVRLEDLDRGKSATMRDSVFNLPSLDGVRFVHNFWTDESIRPSTRYRLTLTGPDGARSVSEVVTPDSVPQPFVLFNPTFQIAQIEIDTDDRIADLRIQYTFARPARGDTLVLDRSYVEDLQEGRQRWFVRVPLITDIRDFQNLNGRALDLVRIEAFVAIAGPSWPDFAVIDDETFALPRAISNVDAGVGFFGAVVTKRFTLVGSR